MLGVVKRRHSIFCSVYCHLNNYALLVYFHIKRLYCKKELLGEGGGNGRTVGKAGF